MISRTFLRSITAVLFTALLVSQCMIMVAPGTGMCAAGEGEGGWADTRGPGNGEADSLLFVASRGELYRGTNRGVWVYDTTAGTWSPTGGGLSEYNVYSLAWDGTGLYAGTGDEVWRYDPASRLWTNMNHGGGMSLVWTGSVLYSGDWEGVWRYDPAAGTWTDTGGGIATQVVNALAWTGTHLYAGTREAGVWRYDPAAGNWTDTGGGMSSDEITSLAWGGSRLYAAKNSGSVWRYNPGAGSWADISGAVAGYPVYSLAWDGSGLYAGTIDHGVWRYDTGTGTWQDKSGALGAERVHSLAWDGSRLYAGTEDNGVWRYAPGSGAWTDTGGGVSSYAVEDLAWDGSRLYAATGDGVFRYDPSTGAWARYGNEVGGYAVTCLSWEGAGSFYAGTAGGGVWRYDQGSGNWVDTGGGVSSYVVEDLAWGGSRLYAGTYDNGVWSYDPGTTSWADTGGDMSTKTALSLSWSGTSLYAGTDGNGVWRYDPGGGNWSDLAGPGAFAVRSLAWDGTGIYAGGEGNGIWHYDPTNGWARVAAAISNRTCYALAWDGSRLYAGCDGIWAYDPANGACVDTDGFIARGNVKSIAAAGSRIYAGTGKWGVWALDTSVRTWYLAEGSTDGGMETFVLVQNPGDSAVPVDITFMTSAGAVPGPQGFNIPAQSRVTFKVNEFVTDYNVSTMVTSRGGDIICERAMYGNGRTWAHESIGVTSPMDDWYLAEGSTDGGMETWVLVQNPNDTPVNVDVTFMTGSGSETPEELRSFPVGANSRVSFNAGTYVTDYNLSTRVRSFGGGVICERAMYGNGRAWAHDSIGVTAPSDTWYLAEGSTDGGMETWVLVQNPNEDQVLVDLTLMTAEGEQKPPGFQDQPVPGSSRRTFRLNDYVQSFDVSTRVFSEGGNVICERAMYGGNRTWAHDSIGVTLPATTWYLAEGCTDGGMETWVLVQNPTMDNTYVDIVFQTEKGEVALPALQQVYIPPLSRKSFRLNDYVQSFNVSTTVAAKANIKGNIVDGHVVCERAMYGNDRTWAHDSIGYAP